MFNLASRFSPLRRIMFVAFSVAAVLALAVPPAYADGGHLRAGRDIALSGDRTFFRTNITFNNVSPTGQLGVMLKFGGAEVDDTVGMRLIQDGGTRTSRRVFSYTYGEKFVNVSGVGCTAGSFTECDRNGFDWLAGRLYQVVVERGGKNSNGWLWSMSIKDLKTGTRVPLLTLRTPYGQLNATGGVAVLDIDPANCENIDAAAGIITKPRREDGTAFSWGATNGWKEGCPEATTAAPVVKGNTKLRITQ